MRCAILDIDIEHIADGGAQFDLVPRSSTGDNPTWVAALRDHLLETAVRDFGVSFGGEPGIGRANQAAYDAHTPVATQKYSAAVAAVFARMPTGAVRFGPPEREERDLNDR
jgi:hypothetical protein